MAGEEKGTELVVPDPLSGEAIAVRDVEVDRLADAMLKVDTKRDQLREAEGILSAEVLRRMDAEAKWTQRVPIPGEDGRVYELKGASPDAGTTSYDVEVLEGQLLPLVAEGVITRDLFEQVVKRTVVVELDAHDTVRLEAFAKTLGAKVRESKKATRDGVGRLSKLKNERVDAAVEEAKRVSSPNRRATVKVVDRNQSKKG